MKWSIFKNFYASDFGVFFLYFLFFQRAFFSFLWYHIIKEMREQRLSLCPFLFQSMRACVCLYVLVYKKYKKHTIWNKRKTENTNTQEFRLIVCLYEHLFFINIVSFSLVQIFTVCTNWFLFNGFIFGWNKCKRNAKYIYTHTYTHPHSRIHTKSSEGDEIVL